MHGQMDQLLVAAKKSYRMFAALGIYVKLNFKDSCALLLLLNDASLVGNKPTCARVAAMTTLVLNKSKQNSFNA